MDVPLLLAGLGLFLSGLTGCTIDVDRLLDHIVDIDTTHKYCVVMSELVAFALGKAMVRWTLRITTEMRVLSFTLTLRDRNATIGGCGSSKADWPNVDVIE